jgi:formylglycine-generating enzyme required for sulfatase activity
VRKHRVLAASLLAILLVSLVATAVTVREWLRTQARASEVMRLAALQVLDDLVAEADGLWPPVPARIASYESWLGRAEELLSSRPQHEATLARLRARAVWVAGAEGDPRWAFSSSEDQWWHNQIEKLVAGLRTLADAENGLASSGVSPSHGWGVRRRLLFAREVEERSLTDAAAAERWREALDSIADPARCPLYRGLRLAPQLGLLPLGRDQGTGLWEFAHLQSGEPARRDAAGTLLIAEETGLVLVLVPGGDFWMGAQAIDPSGRNYDPLADEEEAGVHEVTLSPYLLAKHEMTQGQWQRATGRNPSRYGPHNYYGEWNRAGNTSGLWLHPVEQVSWLECVRVCGQLGLVLPSEAQWEHAARAGTSTPWWTGSERTSLAGAANLLDGYARTHGGEDWRDRVHDPWLDDGHTVHAPVASYAPNAFGLHDVLGNVWEWCLDRFDLDLSFYANGPRYDPVNDPTGARVVTRRGGSYYNSSTDSRGSGRGADPPENVSHSLGLRPARPLEGLAPAGR